MVRVKTKIRGFCLRFRKTRIRIGSPPKLQTNPAYNSIKSSHNKEYYNNVYASSFSSDTPRTSDVNSPKTESKDDVIMNNRIMVVVDSSQEAKGALQWALSHTVQNEDTIILLHIAKPSSKSCSNSEARINPKAYGLLYSMKAVCQTRRSGVEVEVVAIAGKDKGEMIVEQAKEHKASLLVVGHKKRSKAWRLLVRWTRRNNNNSSVVDYCIQNADCMTIAVWRKNKKLGGYLITTKRHKNFWLMV